jgi:hypothetical protein
MIILTQIAIMLFFIALMLFSICILVAYLLNYYYNFKYLKGGNTYQYTLVTLSRWFANEDKKVSWILDNLVKEMPNIDASRLRDEFRFIFKSENNENS